MKGQLGVGFLPYEIGDKVLIHRYTKEFIIEDMRMIQYVKDKKIEFEVLLDGVWYSSDWIKQRII